MDGWMPWVIGIVLTGFFGLIATANAMVFYEGGIKGKKVGSSVPFIGGFFGVIGFVTLPIEGLKAWWWVPLVVDVTCIPALIYFPFWWLFLRKNDQNGLSSDEEKED